MKFQGGLKSSKPMLLSDCPTPTSGGSILFWVLPGSCLGAHRSEWGVVRKLIYLSINSLWLGF